MPGGEGMTSRLDSFARRLGLAQVGVPPSVLHRQWSGLLDQAAMGWLALMISKYLAALVDF